MRRQAARGLSAAMRPAGPGAGRPAGLRQALRRLGTQEWTPRVDAVPDAGHQDWIVPGVHVLWDDRAAMRLRRRTKLLWAAAPRSVLLVKKWEDERVAEQMREIAAWLATRGVRVLVEEQVQRHEMPEFEAFRQGEGPRPDFAVTLGGDGTLLHLANLFGGDAAHDESSGAARPPPVVSFGMGTLVSRPHSPSRPGWALVGVSWVDWAWLLRGSGVPDAV